MEIKYDSDFEKVMTELQTNFGWSNIDVLPDSYRDLLNDTIKAVKNCSIHNVGNHVFCECNIPTTTFIETDWCTSCRKSIKYDESK